MSETLHNAHEWTRLLATSHSAQAGYAVATLRGIAKRIPCRTRGRGSLPKSDPAHYLYCARCNARRALAEMGES